jgi:hypothetical protein
MAVQMHQFQHQDLLPAVLERDALASGVLESLLEQLADDLARFHAIAAVATCQQDFGSAQQVRLPAIANLEVLEQLLGTEPRLVALRRWTEDQAERLASCFEARRAGGWIRECHGDLHLGNMVLWQGRLRVFDCLEFSPPLRWIDLTSDMAFLVMDLHQRRRSDLAALILNRWLELTGDYAGLRCWRWYLVYRALVRAKVAGLRLQESDSASAEAPALRSEIHSYLGLAEATAGEAAPVMLITHGFSGSGKSHLAGLLARRLGWIHLRSDVERKRQFGLWGLPLGPARNGDPYAAGVSDQLYGDHLPACAEAVLGAGLSLIVDATFLERRHRRRFADLAFACGARFLILDCRCSPDLARQRLKARHALGLDPSDADAAVLEQQLGQRDPLEASERAAALVVVASETEPASPPVDPDLFTSGPGEDGVLLERLVARLGTRAGAQP